jgi:predicted lipoprotein with Yx(FWY)xxD motif
MMMAANRGYPAVAGVGIALAACLSGCAGSESSVATASTASAPAQSPAAAETQPSDLSSQPVSGSPDPEQAQSPTTGIVITSAGSNYGQMLFNDDGQAIYIWEREKSAKPRCYGDCAQAWPPVLTDGGPVAAGRVSAKKLGTTQRSDGTTQVTYYGHPLYYYTDELPGEVRCHNVATHGGLWWVITPKGVRAP